MSEFATIPAIEAHIWWCRDPRRLTVVRFRPGQARALEAKGFDRDVGASELSWKEESPAVRLQLLREMAIEFMVDGHDPGHVIREFAKVREFAELGGKSYPMCRVLTEVIEGSANEDFERFRDRYL